MDTYSDFILDELLRSDHPIYIDFLAKRYIKCHYRYSEDTVEYEDSFDHSMRCFRSSINKINRMALCSGFDGSVIEYISAEKNAIKRGSEFTSYIAMNDSNYEDANLFSDRIGKEILKRLNCRTGDLIVTSNSKDGGIDFWGVFRTMSQSIHLTPEVLVVGQVKKYKGKVSVADIREFIGAVSTAKNNCYFGRNINNQTPTIMIFVTTGYLTEAAIDTARINSIQVIGKRELSELKIL
jgi:hypothetical protein